MSPKRPKPPNERRWRVHVVDATGLQTIDVRSCNGKGVVLVSSFEKRSRPRQQALLDRFLKSCRPSDRSTYLRECRGFRFRFWINSDQSSIIILNAESAITRVQH